MRLFDACLSRVQPLSNLYSDLAQKRLDSQIRPARSLGMLEEMVAKLAAIQEKERPSIERKCVYVFAGDHGITEENVSCYPREVTPQMVYSFLAGKATINVLARAARAGVKVIDMGVDHDFPRWDDLIIKKVGYGTANFMRGPAMSEEACRRAMETGIALAMEAKREGIELAATGDMGIGNTTPSSAVIAAITGKSPREVTGRGTGIDDEGLRRKIEVIEKALEVNQSLLTDPVRVLQAVGGYEHAGIAGFVLGCAAEKIPVIVDGLVSSAGALVALELHPHIKEYVLWGHRSFERGHDAVITRYQGRAILDLDMRLGEGSGACLSMQILDTAVKIYNEVATFEEARVATRKILEEKNV